MLDKLKGILGKDAGGTKPQRQMPLKPLKQTVEPVKLSLDEIPHWLDEQEIACKKNRSETLTQSRRVIEQLLPLIREHVLTVDSIPTNEALHPKVVQVNTQQLPLFKSKMFSALDVTFSDDDEEFYAQITIILSATFKAFRGPGRYLHQSYPQGMKEIRDHLDSFGKEINVMTAIIKSSRERLADLEAVRQAYNNYEELMLQCSNVDAMKSKMHEKLEECKEKQTQLQNEESAYYKSGEYYVYEYHRTDRDQQEAILDEARKALQLQLSTSIQVWKRAKHEFQALSDKQSENTLSKLIIFAEQNGVESDPKKIIDDLQTVVYPLFQLIESDKITLKNAAERRYFSEPPDYIEELKDAFEKYKQKMAKYDEAEAALANQEAPMIILEMKDKIQKLQEEINEIETKISKGVRREVNEEELENARSDLLNKLTVCASHNLQNQISVIITDLRENST